MEGGVSAANEAFHFSGLKSGKRNTHGIPLFKIKIMGKEGWREVKKWKALSLCSQRSLPLPSPGSNQWTHGPGGYDILTLHIL